MNNKRLQAKLLGYSIQAATEKAHREELKRKEYSDYYIKLAAATFMAAVMFLPYFVGKV